MLIKKLWVKDSQTKPSVICWKENNKGINANVKKDVSLAFLIVKTPTAPRAVAEMKLAPAEKHIFFLQVNEK